MVIINVSYIIIITIIIGIIITTTTTTNSTCNAVSSRCFGTIVPYREDAQQMK
jgi:hypothetical protein